MALARFVPQQLGKHRDRQQKRDADHARAYDTDRPVAKFPPEQPVHHEADKRDEGDQIKVVGHKLKFKSLQVCKFTSLQV